MKTCITFLLLLVITITCNAQSIDGKWKGKIMSPNGEFELLYTFKVDANSLTGDVASEMGSIPIENGKVNGNEFSFDVSFNGQTFSNKGVLEGDVIKISAPMMEEPMVITRVMDKSKIDGEWMGTASSPQGDFELTFLFKVEGDKLSGKNSSAMGEVDLTNGTVNGNDFSFDVDIQGMTVSHKCKYLEDDSIEVKALVMDNEMVMKLTRKAK